MTISKAIIYRLVSDTKKKKQENSCGIEMGGRCFDYERTVVEERGTEGVWLYKRTVVEERWMEEF